MRFLLDTHILVWALSGESSLLSDEVIGLINDRNNEIYYSAASVWETAIKNKVRPGQMGITELDMIRFCDRSDYRQLAITREHAAAVSTLHLQDNAPRHKDPFDMLLLAQAKYENMRLISHDEKLKYYNEPCLMLM